MALDRDGTQARRRPKPQDLVKSEGVGQLEGGDHLLDMAHHQIHQRAFDQPKAIPHRRHHDVPHARPHDDLLERTGEILQNHDGFGAAIV